MNSYGKEPECLPLRCASAEPSLCSPEATVLSAGCSPAQLRGPGFSSANAHQLAQITQQREEQPREAAHLEHHQAAREYAPPLYDNPTQVHAYDDCLELMCTKLHQLESQVGRAEKGYTRTQEERAHAEAKTSSTLAEVSRALENVTRAQQDSAAKAAAYNTEHAAQMAVLLERMDQLQGQLSQPTQPVPHVAKPKRSYHAAAKSLYQYLGGITPQRQAAAPLSPAPDSPAAEHSARISNSGSPFPLLPSSRAQFPPFEVVWPTRGLDPKTDESDPEAFLDCLELQMMVNFIDPNIWGPAALFNHIDSSLKDSLRGLLHLHPPRSWKDLKRVYLLADPPMLTTTEARDMLGQLKLDVTRPFGEYVFKFERLRRHAGLDRCSNETIDFFMLGLNTYLEAEAEEVYLDMQPGDDIEALYQFIREAEHHLY